jgi:hypothetical protein
VNTEEIEALEKQTDNVVANLKYIQENGDDFDDLEKQTSNIVGNLKFIEHNDSGDYDDLEKQTDVIAGNLICISDDETNLKELEERLDRILEKLDQVKRRQFKRLYRHRILLAKEDVASSSLVTRFRPLVPRGLPPSLKLREDKPARHGPLPRLGL